MRSRVAVTTSLVRWLGPWSGGRGPAARRERWTLRDGRMHGFRAGCRGMQPSFDEPSLLEALVYRPAGEPVGAYLIVPGLHFLGPDDPRLDRFCRVLARAGFLVAAPVVPSFSDLLVHPSAADDVEACARAVIARGGFPGRLALFSISFGSWPALEVAARLGDAVDGVVTFGGYADFHAAVMFCVEGVMYRDGEAIPLSRDPLNQPALFLNVLDHLEGVQGQDTESLEAAWREMTHRTWGKPELKEAGRLEPIARQVSLRVPETQRDLFLIGCGVRPGAIELVRSALDRSREKWRFADPTAAVRRLDCPVVICHGRDDDVIPFGEAEKLQRALGSRVPTRLFLTGLYGHTSGGAAPSASVREGKTLLGMARAIASGGALRQHVRTVIRPDGRRAGLTGMEVRR